MSTSSTSKKPLFFEDPRLKEREIVLRAVKEIVVKFIEMGRVTPANFPDVFKLVHDTIVRAVGGYPPSTESQASKTGNE